LKRLSLRIVRYVRFLFGKENLAQHPFDRVIRSSFLNHDGTRCSSSDRADGPELHKSGKLFRKHKRSFCDSERMSKN